MGITLQRIHEKIHRQWTQAVTPPEGQTTRKTPPCLTIPHRILHIHRHITTQRYGSQRWFKFYINNINPKVIHTLNIINGLDLIVFKKIVIVYKMILKNSNSFKKLKKLAMLEISDKIFAQCQKFLTVFLCVFLLLLEISYNFMTTF